MVAYLSVINHLLHYTAMQVNAALEVLAAFSSGWVGVEDAVALVEGPTVAQMQLTGGREVILLKCSC
jgi:hypothetical protein